MLSRATGLLQRHNPRRRALLPMLALLLGLVSSLRPTATLTIAAEPVSATTEPTTEWGSDHVGQAWPEYVTGDECLFCHRQIGASWPQNPHQLSLRHADRQDAALRELAGKHADLAGQVQFLLGSGQRVQFLKRAVAYGKLDLLVPSESQVSLPATRQEAKQQETKRPTTALQQRNRELTPNSTSVITGHTAFRWDSQQFAERCAGCHATAVDATTGAFSSLGLDCVTCHGVVPLQHTGDKRLALLSSQHLSSSQTARQRRQAELQVISICGQCHLRGGVSLSTKRPYPNTFVAGDNLFRDFQVLQQSSSKPTRHQADDRANRIDDQQDRMAWGTLPPRQRHIYENAVDVVIREQTGTCLQCHSVHHDDGLRHQQLPHTDRCDTCHVPHSDHAELRPDYHRSYTHPVCQME